MNYLHPDLLKCGSQKTKYEVIGVIHCPQSQFKDSVYEVMVQRNDKWCKFKDRYAKYVDQREVLTKSIPHVIIYKQIDELVLCPGRKKG